ncbi:MAG: hypothetical protein IPL52_05715 [Flavobacteriales bacterium]|nr:hypothetical protein [Flavobacteriales bacterium]
MLPGIRTALICACAALVGGEVVAQDLQQVGKKGGVNLTGGLSAFGAMYTTDLDDPRLSPYSWGLSGRLNLSIYELQLPFSFVFSEKERDFRQPFNQFGISPRYKWATAHIGHRSMHFSELTMNGQRFFGGGLELSPGKFRFAAMYGRLRKEIFADTTTEVIEEPAFERTGMAMKLGGGTQATHVDVVLFQAKDDYDAIALRNGRYGDAQPEENLVLGLGAAVQVAKSLQWQFDAAGSLHNVGVVPDERTGDLADAANNYDSFLFNVDPRSRRGAAVKTGLSLNVRGTTFSVNYDRIDPLFQTLGNYFFMRDVENYRASVGTGLFKQKLRATVSLGLQTNNIKESLALRTRRTIGSASLTYNSGKVVTTSLSWSNFEANVRSAYEAAGTDTLELRQVSDNITLNNNLRFRNTAKGSTRSMDIALGYQAFVNEGYPSQPAMTTVTYTGSVGYRSAVKPRAFSWGVRLTTSLFESAGLGRIKYGTSLNARKGINKDRTGVNARAAFYLNRGEHYGGSTSLVANAGLDQRLGQTHRLGLGVNYNGRSTNERFENSQYQMRLQLTYSAEFRKRERKPKTP